MIAAYMNCADCLFGISHKHFAGGGGGWGGDFPDEQLNRSQSVNKTTAEREVKTSIHFTHRSQKSNSKIR